MLLTYRVTERELQYKLLVQYDFQCCTLCLHVFSSQFTYKATKWFEMAQSFYIVKFWSSLWIKIWCKPKSQIPTGSSLNKKQILDILALPNIPSYFNPIFQIVYFYISIILVYKGKKVNFLGLFSIFKSIVSILSFFPTPNWHLS